MKDTFLRTLVLTITSLASAWAQQPDSVRVLTEVEVKAFAYQRPLAEVPSSIALIQSEQLNRFSNTSFLPVVNTIPGVRMEERSPGSYRFAIRGSSLRSPFGVRNVKFYWRGLPLTDGGGNTYLNLLDFNTIGSMEVIKGPGASLYGAGTGGVVLLEPPASKQPMNYSLLGGSYGLFRANGGGTVISTNRSTLSFQMGYQKADGYRQQAKMNRLAAQINWDYRIGNKGLLSWTYLSSQLYYQTPGGLTLAQYQEDPRQARPAGATPGAVDQKAAVTNKTNYTGISYLYDWNDKWNTTVGIFGSFTDFENPTIRNYETRAEKSGGLRATTTYTHEGNDWKMKWTAGTEVQWFGSILKVNGNQAGQKTEQRISDDDLGAAQQLYFLQADFDLPYQFLLTTGASINSLRYTDANRLTTESLARSFPMETSPRVALLKKITSRISVHTSLSRGFSSPTFAEAVPSSGGFNRSLRAEAGVNYEIGIRGEVGGFHWELTHYWFQLRNAIVIQRASDGADYFVNAGATRQKGIEAMASYERNLSAGLLSSLRTWISYTGNAYSFTDYVNGGKDYSGNRLTGVPRNVFVSGLDLKMRAGLYLNLTSSFTDRLPLDDANSTFANSYWLIGARMGYRKAGGHLPFEPFVGVDNAGNAHYSLGNDLNAVGARFYNAAPARNYYLGLSLLLNSPRK